MDEHYISVWDHMISRKKINDFRFSQKLSFLESIIICLHVYLDFNHTKLAYTTEFSSGVH